MVKDRVESSASRAAREPVARSFPKFAGAARGSPGLPKRLDRCAQVLDEFASISKLMAPSKEEQE